VPPIAERCRWLVAIDITLAGLFWAMTPDENVIACQEVWSDLTRT
jgi:hypothetical protein